MKLNASHNDIQRMVGAEDSIICSLGQLYVDNIAFGNEAMSQ